jgi:cytidylate kinase
MKEITIAIDGFSSCGKSTMAKELAKTIGYIYIDSGAMYRAVTLFSLERGLVEAGEVNMDGLRRSLGEVQISFRLSESGRPETYLNGVNVEQEIRSMEVSSFVSAIAALDFVRTAMVAQQQELGKAKGIVMDGRDIGTTVFPDAELKIFVTASTEVRAKRRYDELTGKGTKISLEEVKKNIEARDHIDQNRTISPLRKAHDALLLDNSSLTPEEQNQWLLAEYRRIAL